MTLTPLVGRRLRVATNAVPRFRWLKSVSLALLSLVPVAFHPSARAQVMVPDTDFASFAGMKAITTLAVQSDGKILIGENFNNLNGFAGFTMIRLNPDGTPDDGFTGTMSQSGKISAIAVQSDEGILVGGAFTNINGQPRQNLARLKPDGTLDTNFTATVASPYSGEAVNAITLASDGKLLVGGPFTNVNGIERLFLARLNPDGTLDSDYAPRLDLPVVYLVVENDDSAIVAKKFPNHLQESNSIRRVKPDGSIDTFYNPGNQISVYDYGEFDGLSLQSDGKLIVFGNNFAFITNYPFGGRIARFNTDGTWDNSFSFYPRDPRIGHDPIKSLCLQANGKLVIGTIARPTNGGTQTTALIRLNTDGSIDPSFNPGGFVVGVVNGVAVDPSGKGIIYAGDLSSVNGSPSGSVARMKTVPNAFLQSMPLSGAGLEILLTGETGRTYRIDASTNLFDWFSLGTVTLTNSTQSFVDSNPPGFDRRFYRAKVVP